MHLDWMAGIHHDGSAMYVSNLLPASGETVTLRLRTPIDAPVRQVYLRTVPDGEGLYSAMKPVKQDVMNVWWEGQMRITMPRNPYRFKVVAEHGSYYFNGLGALRAETLDLFDFKLLANYSAPSWLNDSVFYHIFVDRFFNGDTSSDVPPGAWNRGNFTTQRRAWGEPPLSWSEGGNLDFFGGDLPGIAQKLDYLLDLGVNTVYLTPIFTALTNHRYDTIDFLNIDPHVGGNAALADLRRALDRAGMRLVLDIVVNHVGWQHPWFTAAQADASAPTAEYFTFHRHPDRYESWLGHDSLVKLNYRSQALRDVLYRSEESVLRHWMHEPYRIDGWRLDVFHMMARQGEIRLEHKIGREMRRILKADNPQLYLYGEHSFDATPHLQGDELDGVMNYQGFSIPLRRWLTTFLGNEWVEAETDSVLLSGEALAEQWRFARAPIPWISVQQQYHMLSSHDITRILTAVQGDKSLMKVGTLLLMTYPGVPAIYYGDEIAMEGGQDPDNRQCMEWDPAKWDTDMWSFHQKLIRLRRSAPALLEGSFQHLFATNGLMVYQRQAQDQRFIVIGYRGPEPLLNAVIPVRHAGIADGTELADLIGGGAYQVEGGSLHLGDLPKGTAMLLEAR